MAFMELLQVMACTANKLSDKLTFMLTETQ
jgi:hypothetical protein